MPAKPSSTTKQAGGCIQLHPTGAGKQLGIAEEKLDYDLLGRLTEKITLQSALGYEFDMQNKQNLGERIATSEFFSRMGCDPDLENNVIYVRDVFKVFVEPVDSDFQGDYKNFEWLPTSPTQDDPFHSFPKPPKELVDLRINVSKAVVQSIKGVSKDKFIAGAEHSVLLRAG